MRKIELVFRTVGERTSEVALDLAIQHIGPDQVHLIDHVTPFSRAVQQMLEIPYQADIVVFMDADCLILEDMSDFVRTTTQPYTDCYVLDRFRGRIHAGVHITRLDVVRAMQQVRVDPDDLKYILRPESYIRHLALERLDAYKVAAPFRIFHDFCQFYRDIFAKYALRELRSRTPENRAKLDRIMEGWTREDRDLEMARYAVEYTRAAVPTDTPEREIDEYIAALPQIARREIMSMDLSEKPPLTRQEVASVERRFGEQLNSRERKVFGIGLSRTGTKSLTKALDILGITIAHNPVDEITFRELASGEYTLSILGSAGFDGIADIAAAAFYPQLDRAYPNSKFIFTTRDKESWLDSMEQHWYEKPIFEDVPGQESKLKMRRFLRASMYGLYTFNRERLSFAYDRHHQSVLDHFAHRPGDLLVLDICAGEGWERLCPFLELPLVEGPLPHVRSKSTIAGITGNPPKGGAALPAEPPVPARRLVAAALCRNETGEVLLVKPTYRDTWLLPGGMVEAEESPHDGCVREVREELGLSLDCTRLLCVDYRAPQGGKSEAIHFLFDGGLLSAAQVAAIRLPAEELSDARFFSPEEAARRLPTRGGQMLRSVLDSGPQELPCYLEEALPLPWPGNEDAA